MWIDYEDKYAVSEDGLVMHKKSSRITQGSLRNGYWRIHLGNNKRVDVHLMVARCFLPKIDASDLQIDHIDRDRTNNNASNLRWCDKSTQMINREYPPGISGHHRIKINKGGSFWVRLMRNGHSINKTFDTLEEAIVARDKILAEYNTPI